LEINGQGLPIRYEKNPKRSVLEAMKRAINTGVPDIRGDELVCDSMEAMLKIMTRSRFEAFAAIVEKRPNSVYELARVLGKDQGNVLRDVKSLESLGLIKLKSVKDGERERLMPMPLYNKIVLEFEPKKVVGLK
jgi:predicted transcriptional regulator